MGWFLVPSGPSSRVLQAFLVINGMFPSKSWVCALGCGHTRCTSENPFTVWAPPLGKSSSQNWALGVRFGAGEGVRKEGR